MLKCIAAAALTLSLLVPLASCSAPGASPPPLPAPSGKGAVVQPSGGGSSSGGKTTLRIASLTETGQLEYAVNQFKTAHPDVDVQLTNFSQQIVGMKSSGQAIDIGPMIDQLNTQMMSGAGPDIIDVDYLPYYRFVDKGMLADLGALMAGDKGFDRSLYLDNIFSACERDGKLYTVPSSFTFSVLACRAEYSPGSGNVTVRQFLDKAESLPSGVFATIWFDPIDLFTTYMQDSLCNFIDYSTHTARFDTPDFIDAIKAFKSLADTKMSAVDRADGKEYEQLMKGTVAYSVEEIRRQMDMVMAESAIGDSAVFTNVPVMGDGSAYPFTARDMLAINAASKNIDASWGFIKTMLSQDVQTNRAVDGFPLMKAACQAKVNDMASPQAAVNKSGKKAGVQVGSSDMTLKPLSASDVAWLSERVGKLNKLSTSDDTIIKIIEDELPPFFAGQKSAEDVAALIQNRVNIVLNE